MGKSVQGMPAAPPAPPGRPTKREMTERAGETTISLARLTAEFRPAHGGRFSNGP